MKLLAVLVNEWFNKKSKFAGWNFLCGFLNDHQFVFVFVIFGVGVEFHIFYNLPESKQAEVNVGNEKRKI